MQRASIEMALNQGHQTGLEQGIEIGIEQGLEQGIEIGIEQGAKAKAIDIAKQLLATFDDATIATMTGLSLQEITQLRK